jgi:hypothetical protein
MPNVYEIGWMIRALGPDCFVEKYAALTRGMEWAMAAFHAASSDYEARRWMECWVACHAIACSL